MMIYSIIRGAAIEWIMDALPSRNLSTETAPGGNLHTRAHSTESKPRSTLQISRMSNASTVKKRDIMLPTARN
jgi:hypothetical protein